MKDNVIKIGSRFIEIDNGSDFCIIVLQNLCQVALNESKLTFDFIGGQTRMMEFRNRDEAALIYAEFRKHMGFAGG